MVIANPASAAPLTVDVTGLLPHWRWFGEWSLGCIGGLGDWLVETVDTLCKEGATTLTIEAFTRHALQPDQRVRMEMEARTGEHKVERAKAQSKQELQRLLGNLAALPATAPADLSANGNSLNVINCTVGPNRPLEDRKEHEDEVSREEPWSSPHVSWRHPAAWQGA